MTRCVMVLLFCAIANLASVPAKAADDLDSRIEALEKQNQALKKQIRIQALEKENLALSKKLGADSPAELPARPERKQARSELTDVSSSRTTVANQGALLGAVPVRADERYVGDRWAGFYVGLSGVAGFGGWNIEGWGSYAFAGGSTQVAQIADGKTQSSGKGLGFQAGKLWQNGNWVFGPEVDFVYGNVRGMNQTLSISTSSCPNCAPSSYAMGSQVIGEVNWLSTLRGRVGFATNDLLIFATGGASLANVRAIASNAYPGFSGINKTVIGFAVGGGVQYAINQSWSLRAEYEYIGLPTTTSSVSYSSGLGDRYSSNLSFNPSFQVVKAGVDWKLN